MLLLFLPPLIYNAAFFTAPRETRENAVLITALAVGTTAVTIGGVGLVAHLVVPGVSWAPALAAFGLAVEAMAHPFTYAHGAARLAEVVIGGIAWGIVVAFVIGRIRHRVRDPAIQILVTLVTPFVAPLLRLLPGRHPAFVLNPWRQRLVIGWGRMRGAISLAIALTRPETLNGRPFGQRSTLILLAAVVVVLTLIGEGLTLAPLLRALGLAQSDQQPRLEARARARVTEAGLARLDELAEAGEVDEDTANLYRQLFEMRLDRVRAVLDDDSDSDGDNNGDGPRRGGYHGFRAELLTAQRVTLDELYRDGKTTDDVRRTIARTLDLQEPRAALSRSMLGRSATCWPKLGPTTRRYQRTCRIVAWPVGRWPQEHGWSCHSQPCAIRRQGSSDVCSGHCQYLGSRG